MAQNHRKKLKRSKLADVLPLSTPFVIHIDVSSACNFKCKFCFHSLEVHKLKESGFNSTIMGFDLFTTAIDKIKEFPDKLKRLCLIRHGEALLNKRLPDMIKYAKEQNIAEQINMSTNGSLLSPEMNTRLIEAGLDEILISVEALSKEKYKEICGVDLDFEAFIDNIRHFYNHKGKCKLHIKIVDVGLEPGEEEKFYRIFDPICDNASIENIVPCFRDVEYANIKDNYNVNIIGNTFRNIKVCPQPFFQLHIYPNGNLSVCNADYNEKIVFGNIITDSLVDIWYGREWVEFRLMHLRGERFMHSYCKLCTGNVCYTSDSDILDDNADRLLEKFLDGKCEVLI